MRVVASLLALLLAALLSGCTGATPSALGSQAEDEDLPQGTVLVRILAIKPSGKGPLDEAVTVANLGSGAAQLTGWTLHDWDDNVYRFPAGFVLMPDASVTIHTGTGADTGEDLHWGLGKPVWDEDDQGLIRDAAGRIRHYLRYDGTMG